MSRIIDKISKDRLYIAEIREAFNFGRVWYETTMVRNEHLDIPERLLNAPNDIRKAIDAGFNSRNNEHRLDEVFYGSN